MFKVTRNLDSQSKYLKSYYIGIDNKILLFFYTIIFENSYFDFKVFEFLNVGSLVLIGIKAITLSILQLEFK